MFQKVIYKRQYNSFNANESLSEDCLCLCV